MFSLLLFVLFVVMPSDISIHGSVISQKLGPTGKYFIIIQYKSTINNNDHNNRR